MPKRVEDLALVPGDVIMSNPKASRPIELWGGIHVDKTGVVLESWDCRLDGPALVVGRPGYTNAMRSNEALLVLANGKLRWIWALDHSHPILVMTDRSAHRKPEV